MYLFYDCIRQQETLPTVLPHKIARHGNSEVDGAYSSEKQMLRQHTDRKETTMLNIITMLK